MDEAGLPEESHESLKVNSNHVCQIVHQSFVGASLSLGSKRSSLCWYNKSCFGCSKN